MGTKIDWESMEPDWRAGIKTKKQLSEEYGVSRAAIDKHWATVGVGRDLTARIRAAAKSKVTQASVTPGVTPHTRVTEQQVIDAEAEIQSRIELAHRNDVPRKRDLVNRLFEELNGITEGQELIAQLQEALSQGDLDALARSAEKVTSLPARIKGAGDLVNAYKTLILLERQVFGIGDGETNNLNDLAETLMRAEARRIER